jgi:flagellin-like hook-associated protein FlgL
MSDITLSKAVRTNLLSLQNTAEMMAKTQERLATGKKVNSALDNPTNFFTASSLNSRAGDLNALMDSMSNGIKTLEAADNGITAITKTLESMQSTLRQARQDKSFQNGIYEVTKDSTITIDGGQYDLPTEIKLGTQTPGTKAELKTTAATPYYGPTVSSAASEKGMGARALINTEGNGLVVGSVIKVAGMEMTLTEGAVVDGNVDANELALQIDAKLNGVGSSERYKYTVSTGAVGSPNEGKVIIESVDPTKAAASVELVSGTNAATKAFTKFNYTAITSSITVGTTPIATGTSFEQFVANLKLSEEEGGYTVEADALTKDIKLIATEHGGPAPNVGGIPGDTPADPGSPSTTTFQIRNDPANAAGNDQTLSIAGFPDVLVTAGMDQAALELAFAGNTDLTDVYDVTVSANLTVTLTEKVPSGDSGPAVTSDKGAATSVPSATNATGGYDFNDTTALGLATAAPVAGLTIDLPGMTTPFVFGTEPTLSDDLDALALAAGPGYTITASATGGLNFSRADGKAFDITIGGGAGAQLGLGATTTVSVAAGTEAGLVGGNAAVASVTGDAPTPAISGQTQTPHGTGVFVETQEADKDVFTVTYDSKSVDINITGVKGGIGSTPANAIDIKNWQDATIARVNAELKTGGITGLEAAFDVDGKFSIVAKTPEAKSIVISKADGIALFGTDAVSTGTATVDGYSSSTPVDKFVEEINRSHAGKLRASNDNGRLRIENLSTKELNVSFDADGEGPGGPVASKITGNSVRENLAVQFNDLKNQLDRLSDDASFNGINLLRGDNLKITFNESGNSFINVQTADGKGLNSASLKVQNLIGIDLDTDDGIDNLLSDIKLALSEVRSQASKFGSNLSIVQNRQQFTKQMINTLETGAANLTLADMNEEAANLLALQTRQSLSSSSLSLASQADQSVLQLLQ